MGNISEKELEKKGFSDAEIRIIKAGTHHQELGLPWDEPVPEELWTKVAEYCDNDVIATEAAFVFSVLESVPRKIWKKTSGFAMRLLNHFRTSFSQEIVGCGVKVMYRFCEIPIMKLILWFSLITKYNLGCERVRLKHEAWDIVNKMLDGKLTPYIQKVINGEMTSKQLADALKTAINSVYGLTSASNADLTSFVSAISSKRISSLLNRVLKTYGI